MRECIKLITEVARTPSLTDKQNELTRGALRKLLEECGGSHAAVGRRIGKDPSWVGRFNSGENGATLETASIIAREAGLAIGELFGITPTLIKTWGELPNFYEALDQARPLAPDYPESVWSSVARLHIEPAPDRIEPAMVLSAAHLVNSLRARRLTSGSDTEPPSARGGFKKSSSRIRKR